MRQRTRKLVGTIILLVWVMIYALVVMALTHAAARRFGPVGEPVFYALAGLAWIPVAMIVVAWMSKPDPETD